MFMPTKPARFCARTLGVLLVVIALVAGLGGAPAFADEGKRVVKVMTYNMDAGTDFLYLLLPPVDLGTALQMTVEEVMSTDFTGRAASLANKIAVEQPDLVALQEATLWEMTSAAGTQVIADQLDLLVAALQARGQHYAVVSVQPLTDLPVPLDETTTFRFLDRDAILVRRNPGQAIEVSNPQSGSYDAKVNVLGMFEQVNGWNSVDVKVGPGTIRFFATHLETPLAAEDPTQVLQGEELIGLMEQSPYPVILAGDFNSDASGAGLGPDQTPTAGMLIEAGYAEVWQTLRPNQEGFTWPLYYQDLWEGRDYFPGPERIDLVFVKGVQPLTIKRVGTTQPFASDHAGVVATVLVEK